MGTIVADDCAHYGVLTYRRFAFLRRRSFAGEFLAFAAQPVLAQEDILTALNRHVRGDWGVVGPEDKAENDLSLKEGFRILSAYESSGGEKFWIITEADRASTCVMLPSDY